MEPGDLRESPAGSGESDGGDWREGIPGGDEEVKAAETNGNSQEPALRDTCEDGESDKQKCVGEQLHSPYEEELDPRIQVGEPVGGHQTSISQAIVTWAGKTGLLLAVCWEKKHCDALIFFVLCDISIILWSVQIRLSDQKWADMFISPWGHTVPPKHI